MHGYKWPINCTRIRTMSIRVIVRASNREVGQTMSLALGGISPISRILVGRTLPQQSIMQGYMHARRRQHRVRQDTPTVEREGPLWDSEWQAGREAGWEGAHPSSTGMLSASPLPSSPTAPAGSIGANAA